MQERDMLRDLMALSDEIFGIYGFSRELLERKISPEKKKLLSKKAISCGTEYAKKMQKIYGEISARELAAYLGIILEVKKRPTVGDRVVFAQFLAPRTITVYSDCLDKADPRIREQKLEPILTAEIIKNILIAHEIFHYLEEIYRKEIFTRTEKVELWRLGPIRYRSEILCLGEIAAMSFAKKLAGIKYSPFVLDWFLVSLYDEDMGCGIYKDMMAM